MSDHFPNLNTSSNYELWVRYQSHHGVHGGHSKVYACVNGEITDVQELAIGADNLDGLVEAYYLKYQLPCHGVYWHGLYGRDYRFLFTDEQLVQVLRSVNVSYENQDINDIDRPTGLRILPKPPGFEVSCLATYPPARIVDKRLFVESSTTTIQADIPKLGSETAVLY